MVRVRIRDAREADAGAIWAVHQASVRGVGHQAYTSAQIEAWVGTRTPDDFRTAMTVGDEVMLVAERDGAIVGFGSLHTDEIRAVYVHPSTGRGTGAPLLRALEQRATAVGMPRLHLRSSLNAEPFYRAHGYRRVEETTVVRGRNVPLRCIIMEKLLDV